MEQYSVLSPGKKIKEIRKRLGLKQYEITGGEITRNLISIIENDKATLTVAVAKVVAENINEACKNRNIDFHVSYIYLLEDESKQAMKIVDNFMTDSIVDNIKDCNELEEFISKYDIGERKSQVYEKIGDFYFRVNDSIKAYEYYIRADECYKNNRTDTNGMDLLLKISDTCILLGEYKKALEINRLLNTCDTTPNEMIIKIYLQRVKIYRMLEDYEMALEEIEYLETIINEENINIIIEKSRCLMDTKHFRGALQGEKKLLDIYETNNMEGKINSYCNIISMYIDLKDNRKIKNFIDQCNDYIETLTREEKRKLSARYYFIFGSAYKFTKQYEKAIEYYDKCIYESRKNKDYDTILSAIDNLLDIYKMLDDIDEMDNVKTELLELMSKDKSLKSHNLIYKLLDFYNEKKEMEMIKSIISFINE